MQLPETLTLAEAAATAGALQAAVASASGELVIDAAPLKAFDSAALALLLQARRLAQARGLGFATRGASAQLVQLAQLYGVAELLQLSAAAPGAGPSY